MKFSITFKSPDCVHDGIEDALSGEIERLQHLLDDGEIDSDEYAERLTTAREELGNLVASWVRGGEYITIQFDTEAQTAIVLS